MLEQAQPSETPESAKALEHMRLRIGQIEDLKPQYLQPGKQSYSLQDAEARNLATNLNHNLEYRCHDYTVF
jgi:hypothetical protein